MRQSAFTVKVKLHMAPHGAAGHILDNVENATIPLYKNNAVPDWRYVPQAAAMTDPVCGKQEERD